MKRVALAVAVLLAGAAGAQEFANGDRRKLQGDWEIVSVTFQGKEMPVPDKGGFKLTFKGDRITSSQGEQEEMTFKLDETKKPRAMQLAKGGQGGQEMKAIYQLDGDTLKIGMALQNMAVMPQSFEDKELAILVL